MEKKENTTHGLTGKVICWMHDKRLEVDLKARKIY